MIAPATVQCMNHSGFEARLDSTESRLDVIEPKVDALEQGGAVRANQIETLCGRMDDLISILETAVGWIVKLFIAILGLMVPVAIWILDKLYMLMIAPK